MRERLDSGKGVAYFVAESIIDLQTLIEEWAKKFPDRFKHQLNMVSFIEGAEQLSKENIMYRVLITYPCLWGE